MNGLRFVPFPVQSQRPMLIRIIEQLDRVYYGRNNFAVVSVKLAQHDLGSAQAADISLSNGLDQDSVDPAGVTGNHADVVEELKDAHTTMLAS